MLNGGLPAWVAEGLPLDDTPADEAELAAPVLAASRPPADVHFHARLQARARPPPTCLLRQLPPGTTCGWGFT